MFVIHFVLIEFHIRKIRNTISYNATFQFLLCIYNLSVTVHCFLQLYTSLLLFSIKFGWILTQKCTFFLLQLSTLLFYGGQPIKYHPIEKHNLY